MTGTCWLCALFYTGLFVGFCWFLILLIKISNRVANLGSKDQQADQPVDQEKPNDRLEEYRKTRPEA